MPVIVQHEGDKPTWAGESNSFWRGLQLGIVSGKGGVHSAKQNSTLLLYASYGHTTCKYTLSLHACAITPICKYTLCCYMHVHSHQHANTHSRYRHVWSHPHANAYSVTHSVVHEATPTCRHSVVTLLYMMHVQSHPCANAHSVTHSVVHDACALTPTCKYTTPLRRAHSSNETCISVQPPKCESNTSLLHNHRIHNRIANNDTVESVSSKHAPTSHTTSSLQHVVLE